MGIDLDLRRLRFFVEVVRQGGFSPATKVVFATQSAVSKAVRQLEDELGLPLLNRIGHRTELTEAGKVVYRRGPDLLARAGDLTVELAALRGLEQGKAASWVRSGRQQRATRRPVCRVSPPLSQNRSADVHS